MAHDIEGMTARRSYEDFVMNLFRSTRDFQPVLFVVHFRPNDLPCRLFRAAFHPL